MLNLKTILITGGSGEFGNMFVKKVLWDYPNVKKIVIYSRDEQKQSLMQELYPREKYPMMRFFIGDVRDAERLKRACEGVDVVIHAAAMSMVKAAEYNPEECIKTNIIGTQNIIDACLYHNVRNIIALSTDKACAPINLYGATKLTAEKLIIAANNIRGSKDIKFSVVRYGNVMGSKDSIIPRFFKLIGDGAVELPITDERMSRFNITQQESASLVLWALEHQMGGEIFVPKVPSYNVVDMAKAIAPHLPIKMVGSRVGEKLYEEIINKADAPNTIDVGRYYVILPSYSAMLSRDKYIEYYKGKFVPDDFEYNSQNNIDWETVDSLKDKIKKYVDPNFQID